MANENALMTLSGEEEDSTDLELDFEELENMLQSQNDENLSDLEIIEKERDSIENPHRLGEVIQNVVWEQFINQIAVTAGEDFIKENRGLTLDLRKSAHIQTAENFEKGNIATHNTEVDYQKRYDDWQKNFVKDENGNIATHTTRSGKKEATLTKDARKPFDMGRPTGSKEAGTAMDHTVPAAEIVRDPAANAFLTKDEQVAFANSDKNLNEMDSSWNSSKGDKSTSEWLDNPNSNGQKPDEIFDMADEDVNKLRDKDQEAREEFERLKKEGEEKAIESGKKSRKTEAKKAAGKALRAAVMSMLAELIKSIIAKLIKWLKETKRTFETLISGIKEAISSFVHDLKNKLLGAADSVATDIVTSILGPIVGTVKKIFSMLKQGWKSLKEAIAYIKSPENKSKPFDILVLEVGKIVVAGLGGIAAVGLGELIEKGLLAIGFTVKIPLLGSLANIIGIFLGAVVAGIAGAVAINLIDKAIAKKKEAALLDKKIDKNNQLLTAQSKMADLQGIKADYIKDKTISNAAESHKNASEYMGSILFRQEENEPEEQDNQGIIDGILADLK